MHAALRNMMHISNHAEHLEMIKAQRLKHGAMSPNKCRSDCVQMRRLPRRAAAAASSRQTKGRQKSHRMLLQQNVISSPGSCQAMPHSRHEWTYPGTSWIITGRCMCDLLSRCMCGIRVDATTSTTCSEAPMDDAGIATYVFAQCEHRKELLGLRVVKHGQVAEVMILDQG